MSTSPPSRAGNNVPEHLILEFLAKGGIVKKCPPGIRSTEVSVGYWGNKRKRPKQETESVAKIK